MFLFIKIEDMEWEDRFRIWMDVLYILEDISWCRGSRGLMFRLNERYLLMSRLCMLFMVVII